MNDYWQRQHVLSFKIFYYSITFLLLIFITLIYSGLSIIRIMKQIIKGNQKYIFYIKLFSNLFYKKFVSLFFISIRHNQLIGLWKLC